MLPDYEWDPVKNVSNEAKHHISFEGATLVFDDPHRIEEPSSQQEHGEARFVDYGSFHFSWTSPENYLGPEGQQR